jgi:hypothetical protein
MNIQRYDGCTALHLAGFYSGERGHAFGALLTRLGADPLLENKYGEDYATLVKVSTDYQTCVYTGHRSYSQKSGADTWRVMLEKGKRHPRHDLETYLCVDCKRWEVRRQASNFCDMEKKFVIGSLRKAKKECGRLQQLDLQAGLGAEKRQVMWYVCPHDDTHWHVGHSVGAKRTAAYKRLRKSSTDVGGSSGSEQKQQKCSKS